MRALLIFLVRCYQVLLRPILPPACRFRPTCSDYMIEALRMRGLFVGFTLGLWRILRCNPFGGSGFDPVPLKSPESAANEEGAEEP